MVLTKRQKTQLDSAVYEYLHLSGHPELAEKFVEEVKLSGVTPPPVRDDPLQSKVTGLLEKKWTTILRLSKKKSELEARVRSLEAEVAELQASGGGGRIRRTRDASNSLPQQPPAHVLKGHRDTVTSVAFHPVFTLMASSSDDATIKIWDYETGKFEKTLKGHTDVVQKVAFSMPNEDGESLLASCAADLTIKLWETHEFACIKTLKGHEHNISGVCFVPGGDFLLSASRDKSIRLWEITTGYCKQTLMGHTEWVRDVVTDDQGKLAASCSNDKTIRLWSLDNNSCVGTLRGHSHVVESVCFTPGSFRLVGPQPPKEAVGGKFLISASRDKTVRIWDLTNLSCAMMLSGHDNWVRGVVCHPNGSYVLSVSDDKSIRVWDVSQKRCIKTIEEAHAHFVSSVALLENAAQPVLATGSVDQTIRLWNMG